MNDDHHCQDPESGVPLITPSYTNNSFAIQTDYLHPDLLREAVFSNTDVLEERLVNFDAPDFLHRRPYGNSSRHLLTLACQDPKVTSRTLKTFFKHLVQKFPFVKFNEPDWYYWDVVHFAAYHVDVEKLRALVETRPEALNSLTLFSENALHVLLGYGRQVESFNVQLSNGWESRICHVIAKEKLEIVECARLLINAGVDINHNNIWNETPLIIAIKYRLLEVIKLLLQHPDIDLDTCKTPKTGKSARDLLREYEIHLDLLNQSTTANVDAVKILFTYLKSDNEETFLRFNNENIRQYANETDGYCTMLELCLIKGYLGYQKDPTITHNSIQGDFDLMKSPILSFFCSYGFGRSVEHLLNNDATIFEKNTVLGNMNVYQMSVKLSYYPFLAILLEHRSNQITKKHLLDQLKRVNESYFNEENFNARHVVHLLVNKLETFERAKNIDMEQQQILSQIMDLYLRHSGCNDQYKENICQLLRMGATLTGQFERKPRLKEVSYETLKMHLDECIDENDRVCYDSFVTDDEQNYSETETLHALCHDPKKIELLNHPALIYLVHYKWLSCNKFFYFNLFLYAAFLVSLYCYVISLQIHRSSNALKSIFSVFLTVQTIKELIQLVLYWRRYFYDLSNYCEMVTIVCCIVNVFGQNQHTMVVAVLLSSCIFLMTLGQLPQFTKYMIVISSTKYFLEYAAFYFIQFVSFALCFFILLPPDRESNDVENALETISLRLFETLIFFIGQYDGDITSVPKFPAFGRFIVAVFIFCMTIILNNLLVGLIVTDMDAIQKNGKLQRQVKMIGFVSRIEKFLERVETILRRSGLLRNCVLLKKYYVTKVFKAGQRKIISISDDLDVFDDDDKAWMRRIHENRIPKRNVLSSLYEYIISEIKSDHKSLKENRDILNKLSRLEEQIRSGGRLR